MWMLVFEPLVDICNVLFMHKMLSLCAALRFRGRETKAQILTGLPGTHSVRNHCSNREMSVSLLRGNWET